MRSRGLPIILGMVLSLAACTSEAATPVKPALVLIGSTPAGPAIKASLEIDRNATVDSVRWDVKFLSSGRVFSLNANFGEGEPNTREFRNGGQWRRFSGRYTVSRRGEHEVLILEGPASALSLLKITENVYHFVDDSGRLIPGNGGWGYALSRQSPLEEKPFELVTISKSLMNIQNGEAMVFTGRTPCVDLKREDITSGSSCLKLKWKLTLTSKPGDDKPNRYKLESTVTRQQPVTGEWNWVNGTHQSPKAVFLELDGRDPRKRITFMVLDDSVIYLMAPDQSLPVGNEDFGFTLTRVR